MVESDPLARIAAAGHLRKASFTDLEAIDGVEPLALQRASRVPSLVVGELDGQGIVTLQGEFPEVKLLQVGRPYGLRKLEQAVRALLAGTCRS